MLNEWTPQPPQSFILFPSNVFFACLFAKKTGRREKIVHSPQEHSQFSLLLCFHQIQSLCQKRYKIYIYNEKRKSPAVYCSLFLRKKSPAPCSSCCSARILLFYLEAYSRRTKIAREEAWGWMKCTV